MFIKALLALAVGTALLVWSLRRLWHSPSLGVLLLSIGAVAILGVAGAHICEVFRFFPAMGWGEQHSVGHYIDFVSATFAATLLPFGFVVTVFRRVRRGRGSVA